MSTSACWLPLVAYSPVPSPRRIVRLALAGVIDYLSAPLEPAELVATLREAVAGTRRLVDERSRQAAARGLVERLSRREREVLIAMARGLSSSQIGEQLGISMRTVEVHRAHVLRKMEAKRASEAVRVAVEASLIA